MYYAGAFENQIVFTRDTLAPLLLRSSVAVEDKRMTVVSTHRSKSITLPVYHLDFGWGKAWMRNNFHDWKITLDIPSGTPPVIRKLFSPHPVGCYKEPTKPILHVYCEGFKEEWMAPRYVDGAGRFTEEVRGQHDIYTLFWLLNEFRS